MSSTTSQLSELDDHSSPSPSPSITSSTSTSAISIFDLPAELFDLIVEHCVGFSPFSPEHFSASFVSRRFRNAVLAIVFRHVDISLLSNPREKDGQTFLDFLLRSPHVCQVVRTVTLRSFHIVQDNELYPQLRGVLMQMYGLRKVKLHYARQAFEAELLEMVDYLPSKPALDIRDFSNWRGYAKIGKPVWDHPLSNLRTLRFEDRADWAPKCFEEGTTTLGHVQRLFTAFPNLTSLDLWIGPRYWHNELDPQIYPETQPTGRVYLPPLKELRLNGPRGHIEPHEEDYSSFLEAIDWPALQTLSLSNDYLTQAILPRFGRQMLSLKTLRISIHPVDHSGGWLASAETQQAICGFLAHHPLIELELLGFPKSIEISTLASPRLRKLTLHNCEVETLPTESNLRSSAELRNLATVAPNIEHLGLDIAHTSRIWFPNATSGIDYDSEIFPIFSTFSLFPKLHTVHLFPRYQLYPNPFAPTGQGPWSQPFTEDSALRTFRHIRSLNPRVQQLLVSSDTFAATMSGSIDPSSWRIWRGGNWSGGGSRLSGIEDAKREEEEIRGEKDDAISKDGDEIEMLTRRRANQGCEERQVWRGGECIKREHRGDEYRRLYLRGTGPRLKVRAIRQVDFG